MSKKVKYLRHPTTNVILAVEITETITLRQLKKQYPDLWKKYQEDQKNPPVPVYEFYHKPVVFRHEGQMCPYTGRTLSVVMNDPECDHNYGRVRKGKQLLCYNCDAKVKK